jgi:ketosteroid isomerase-like protein
MSSGCRSTPVEKTPLHDAYRAALERTGPETVPPPDPASAAEQDGIRRFIDFYAVYSTEQIRAGVREVYADDAFFGDPFHAVDGIDAIESYFLRMAEPVESCTFEVNGVTHNAGEYWFSWIMTLESKAVPGKPIVALGASHVRFNRDGRVVFQQDYWDTSTLFEKLPVVGGLVRHIKRRLDE